ncbi:hypothetical protein ACLOJK_040758 [Asimina triloba]
MVITSHGCHHYRRRARRRCPPRRPSPPASAARRRQHTPPAATVPIAVDEEEDDAIVVLIDTHHRRASRRAIRAIQHEEDDEHILDPSRPQADVPSHHSFFPNTSVFVAVTGEAMIIGSRPSTPLPSPARPSCTACAATATAGAPSCHRLVHPSLQPNECNAHHLSRLRRSANHAWAAIIESRSSIRGSCCRTARSCPLPPSNDSHSTAIKRTSRMHVATPTTHAIADAACSARLRRSRPRECTMQLPPPARRQHWQRRRRPSFCIERSRKSYNTSCYSAHSDFL